MPLDWIDSSKLSINTLLLLERVQLSWFPGWVPEAEMAITLRANPHIEWYLRHKCPELNPWVDQLLSANPGLVREQERIRAAEVTIMDTINDLMVYVVDPTLYDAQPFMAWDANELLMITDFSGKTVIDVGSGTGKLALIAAAKARVVFAVEPVGNLRLFIKQKATAQNIMNVFPVDGLITDIPFPNGFADIAMGGHVFGGTPDAEYAELCRVTRPGGMVILCPGTSMGENPAHEYLLEQGFAWSTFEEPGDGPMRKYWKVITASDKT
jgi:SAM-dependent methyltransferase